MAAITSIQNAKAIHALCIGNNGSGKTGALAGLAAAGYNLRVLDYEGGFEILAQLLAGNDAALARVDVESFIDPYWSQPGTGALRAKDSVAFPKSMQTLAKWGEYGSPTTWGLDTILVIDTLTSMGRAAMNHVFKMKGKLASLSEKDLHPSQPDWGDAMGLQENLLAMLSGLPCHVIVNSHVTFLTPDGEAAQQGFPSALGSKLPPKVGGYFNHMLYFTKQGTGPNKQRGVQTKSASLVETKTSAPGKVKDFYPLDPAKPLEGGLRGYFADVLGSATPPKG